MSSVAVPPVVVSGLALGVDVAAHLQAMESGAPTLAVMATGIDAVYPFRHRNVAARIVDCGALVTDYPPGTAPLKVNFIRRNRIIAGLCDAVVLVESRLKGGGMITADMAFSYGRDVYALPGRADDVRSQGCNWLLRVKKAEPVFSESDLAESLGLGKTEPVQTVDSGTLLRNSFGERLDDKTLSLMAEILSTVRRRRGITLDDLASEINCPWKETRELVGMLECDGLVSVDILQRCTVRPG